MIGAQFVAVCRCRGRLAQARVPDAGRVGDVVPEPGHHAGMCCMVYVGRSCLHSQPSMLRPLINKRRLFMCVDVPLVDGPCSAMY
jgi:hypothetical protein